MDKKKPTALDALELMEREGITAYEAAKRLGISDQAIGQAKRRRERKLAEGLIPCPCCGTMVEPEKILTMAP